MRVFTAKPADLKHYVSMDDEALKRELMAEKWSVGDVPALQFLIRRWVCSIVPRPSHLYVKLLLVINFEPA